MSTVACHNVRGSSDNGTFNRLVIIRIRLNDLKLSGNRHQLHNGKQVD